MAAGVVNGRGGSAGAPLAVEARRRCVGLTGSRCVGLTGSGGAGDDAVDACHSSPIHAVCQQTEENRVAWLECDTHSRTRART